LILAVSLYLIPYLSFIPPAPRARAAGGSGAQSLTLAPGKPLKASTARGTIHSLSIKLDAGQFLRASASQEQIDLRITVHDPGGRRLGEYVCLRGETCAIIFVAASAGAYRLDVAQFNEEADGGTYEFAVGEIRAVEGRDELRIAAAAAQAEGARLLLEWREASLRRAFTSYENALRLWREAGERGGEFYALRKLGDILRSLGELQRSLDFHQRALKVGREAGDARGEAASLNDGGHVLLSLGRNRQALDMFRKSLRLSGAAADRREEARALNNIGEVYYAFGDLPKSIEYYRRAQAVCEAIGDERGLAQALLNIGYSHSDLSETPLALELYDRALRLWQRTGDRRNEALTLTALGHLHAKSGEKQTALSLYDRASQLFLAMGEKIGRAFILNGIGYVHFQLGQRERAREHYQQALAIFREVGYREGEANSLKSLGDVCYSLGELQPALANYRQSLVAIRAMADRRLEPYALKGIGAVYERLGEQARARAFYDRALSLQRKGGDRREAAYTLNSLALFDIGAGRWHAARGRLREALRLNRDAADPSGESLTLYNFARVERGRGNLAEARARAEASLKLVESLRTKVASKDLRASYFASIHQRYEFYIDLLMSMHGAQPGAGFDALALEASERARARSLLETLSEVRGGIRRSVEPSLLERERQLQLSLNDKAERQMLLHGQRNKEAAAGLAKEIEQVAAEYDSVRAQIRVANPRYAALTQPRPLSLGEIQQQVIDEDTLLLEYSLGEERSYVWAVTREGMESHELPGRAQIEGAADSLYKLLVSHQPIDGESREQRRARLASADEQYWERARTLAAIVLDPVAGRLGSKRRLLVVSDGALQYVPFEALPDPSAPAADIQPAAGIEPDAHGGIHAANPLVLRHEIVNQPSASALALLRGETARRGQTNRRPVAVLADPVFEPDDPRVKLPGRANASHGGVERQRVGEADGALRDAGVLSEGGRMVRLLASREEADSIIAAAASSESLKAVGFSASRETATSPDLARYRIVHFATHGLLNNDHPELSGIVLSLVDESGRPVDGFLRLHDIYNLDLPVDLVVLSACSTALGKEVRGEGIIGLSRGFMYAGAASVMASLWKVDDEATAEMMGHFYRNILQNDLPPGAALREAQLSMWRQRQWRAPYFWAAFVLQGEYRERLGATVRPPPEAALSGKLLATGLLFFLSGGGLFVARRRRREKHLTSHPAAPEPRASAERP
jgi:CHAT domain-containing protein/Tfp pilus assembly protein PilF